MSKPLACHNIPIEILDDFIRLSSQPTLGGWCLVSRTSSTSLVRFLLVHLPQTLKGRSAFLKRLVSLASTHIPPIESSTFLLPALATVRSMSSSSLDLRFLTRLRRLKMLALSPSNELVTLGQRLKPTQTTETSLVLAIQWVQDSCY